MSYRGKLKLFVGMLSRSCSADEVVVIPLKYPDYLILTDAAGKGCEIEVNSDEDVLKWAEAEGFSSVHIQEWDSNKRDR